MVDLSVNHIITLMATYERRRQKKTVSNPLVSLSQFIFIKDASLLGGKLNNQAFHAFRAGISTEVFDYNFNHEMVNQYHGLLKR